MKKIAISSLFCMSFAMCEPIEHSDHKPFAEPQTSASCFNYSSKFSLGIESYKTFAYGQNIEFNTATLSIDVTGPVLNVNQEFLYSGIGFLDFSLGALLGVSEATPGAFNALGTASGTTLRRTRSRQGYVGGRLGADIAVMDDTMALRPFIGFTWCRYMTKVLDGSSAGQDFYLTKISFYRPAIGFDCLFKAERAYAKFGLGYEFPWAVFQVSDPEDGSAYMRLTGRKNRVRSARAGLQAMIEGGLNLNSWVELMGNLKFYSIFARGQGTGVLWIRRWAV